MPYITKYRKGELEHETSLIESAGELNYEITKLLLEYLATHGKHYRVMNDIVGALECAKQEFVRRVVNPYEDEKCEANGDVYPE